MATARPSHPRRGSRSYGCAAAIQRAGQPGFAQCSVVLAGPRLDYSHNGIAKIDYNLNEENNIAFRWFVGTGAQIAPVGSPYHEYYGGAQPNAELFTGL